MCVLLLALFWGGGEGLLRRGGRRGCGSEDERADFAHDDGFHGGVRLEELQEVVRGAGADRAFCVSLHNLQPAMHVAILKGTYELVDEETEQVLFLLGLFA